MVKKLLPLQSFSSSSIPSPPRRRCSTLFPTTSCGVSKVKIKVKQANDHSSPRLRLHAHHLSQLQAIEQTFHDYDIDIDTSTTTTTTTTTSSSFHSPPPPPPHHQVLSAVTLAFFSALILTIANPLLSPLAEAAVEIASDTGGKVSSFELLTSAWAGFLAGCLHTLSGPDHLVALAPLSIGRKRRESAIVGALWGCGHDAGQMIFALLFFLLKDQLHINVLEEWGTRLVGLTLLTIGALGIKGTSEVHTTCPSFKNREHDSSPSESLDTTTSEQKRIGLATFATGIVHGLQPDALLVVLPSLTLPSRATGAAFLVTFLAGTVIAMGSYTVFIGSCSQALEQKAPRITEKITLGASLAAVLMGVMILFSEIFGISLH